VRENLKILLVDDDPKNLVALESLLQAEGRELILARSGADALRRVLDDDFALILLDVRMPGIDGFETAELIRARERTADTPIIFLTAAAGEFPTVRGYSLGAVDYIIKPIDPDVLRYKVSVLVDLYRKTAETKAQAAEIARTNEFLSSVLEGVTEHAVAALDREGRVQTWNEGARRIYGYPAEVMVGGTASVLAALRADQPSLRSLLEQVDRHGKVEVELEHLNAYGHRFPAIVHITQRSDQTGAPAGYVFVSRDLTARRQAEEARVLLVAERAARAEAESAQYRLQQILNVLPVTVLVTDAGGRLLMANAVSEALLGSVEIGVKLGQDTLELLLPEGESGEGADLPIERVLRTGAPVRSEQFVVRTRAGRDTPVLVSASAVLEDDGAVVAGVMTMEDITALKEFDRQKDDFLAAVAHDLRNPLMIVAGSAQLLQRRARQLTGPDSEIEVFVDLARSMIRTTRRAASIVDELLDLTRMQMQRPILLDRSFFDLSALVQDAVDELARTTDRHEIHYTGASAFGWWDRGRLHRVVSNLVENAVKYSPDGGVVEVRVTAVDDGAWAELSIVDSGIGIPPDELPSIFKKFYRASNVDGSIDGSGIGLTVAQQITEAHGGALSIESTQGRGTTVSMRLPGVSGER